MAFRRSLFAAATLALLGAYLLTSAPALTADAGVESAVLAKIRANRSGGLIVHSGLLSAARAHSMYMSRHGMNHDNADSRVRNATPDPFETNGAPDDGFGVASWCENVTYSTGHPASEVPGRIYSQWAGSGAHGRCMSDSSRNVGAVGVYYDGTTWWATFIAQVDRTPPGGASSNPAPQKTSAPKPPPAVSNDEPAPPAVSDAPVSQPVADQPASQPAAPTAGEEANITNATQDGTDAGEAREAGALVPSVSVDREALLGADAPITGSREPLTGRAASHPLDYGWQELVAVAGVLAIATLILLRRVRASAPLYVPPDFVAEARRHAAPEPQLAGALPN